ncbi:hypothetical protein GW17_00020679 [Ensete ventricosum]|nr:hypothetical protein GW17_00020679 [Ensete ventricosum]
MAFTPSLPLESIVLLAVALFTEVELPAAPDHSHDHVSLHETHCVHALDLCPRKAPCLRSMFHLLCRLSSYDLDTSLSSAQVTPLLDLHCVDSGPRVHHYMGQLFVEFDFHIDSKCAFI